MCFYRQIDKDIFLLYLKITPNARQQGFNGVVTDNVQQSWLSLKLTAQALEGKANKALLVFLAGYFKVPKSSIKLETGETARYKKVLIKGDLQTDLQALLQQQLQVGVSG